MACSELATDFVILVYSTRKALNLLCLISLARLAHQATCLPRWSSGALHCCLAPGSCFPLPKGVPPLGQQTKPMPKSPCEWAICLSGEWCGGKSVKPMSHSRCPLGNLEGVLVHDAKPAMFELWDEMISIHPNILKTLGEAGFGQVFGDGFGASSSKQDVHIANNLPWRCFNFGCQPRF